MFKTCGRKVPSALGNGTECIGGCGIFIYILHHEELKQVGVGGSKKTCADHLCWCNFNFRHSPPKPRPPRPAGPEISAIIFSGSPPAGLWARSTSQLNNLDSTCYRTSFSSSRNSGCSQACDIFEVTTLSILSCYPPKNTILKPVKIAVHNF